MIYKLNSKKIKRTVLVHVSIPYTNEFYEYAIFIPWNHACLSKREF